MSPRTALVAGGSGLVGGHCLRRLLEDAHYDRVVAVGRRELPLQHPTLTQHVIDFDRLGAADGATIPAADDVFCCLGTTMKKAGSEAGFRLVDFTYIVSLASQALAAGAKQFLLVSSLGAGPKSPLFYNQVKGETEEAIVKLPFAGRYIFRPSLLKGDRPEHRPAERFGLAVTSGIGLALVGPLRRYRPIEASTVAAAMVRVAHQAPGGVVVYASDTIERLGQD
jgi:uncharacterized protein YbjT (DUF2867 family)